MNRSKNEMKLIVPKGSDNAPRKQLVIDFTVAILKQQLEIITDYAAESIIWYQLQENKKVEGLCSVLASVQDETNTIECLEIYQVLTHGKFASINGVISLGPNTIIDFCDVYTFSNAARSGKVKEIKSYRQQSVK
ncbi:hypothetical protein CSV79_10425 [Sporosarcina sp. P13]|uniref:hypothetical protein n=1 Tax=Sporosarcina sp. P13 TaxID=2048263 RepID=UPI000C1705CF|nr:hypothetical protein [Sporosarcina sp. P13]PIC63745.1 hypothetical protein CSV79_10425 [Sporosarcina sp. P13]